jgi:hypothetical protein
MLILKIIFKIKKYYFDIFKIYYARLHISEISSKNNFYFIFKNKVHPYKR